MHKPKVSAGEHLATDCRAFELKHAFGIVSALRERGGDSRHFILKIISSWSHSGRSFHEVGFEKQEEMHI